MKRQDKKRLGKATQRGVNYFPATLGIEGLTC